LTELKNISLKNKKTIFVSIVSMGMDAQCTLHTDKLSPSEVNVFNNQ